MVIDYVKSQARALSKCVRRILPYIPMLIIVLVPYIYRVALVGFKSWSIFDLIPLALVFIAWHIRGAYRYKIGRYREGDFPVANRRYVQSMDNGEKLWIPMMDLPEATIYLYQVEEELERRGYYITNETEQEEE